MVKEYLNYIFCRRETLPACVCVFLARLVMEGIIASGVLHRTLHARLSLTLSV